MDDLAISEYEITRKYLKPPTVSQITEFVSDLGVTYYQFERFYSMPYGIIKQIKGGYRQLPKKFWPVIYERIVPQYGMSFNPNIKQKSTVTRVVTNNLMVNQDSHDRTKTLT